MTKITVSAPGKVALFGEHAVVYGQPALVAAIDKRLYVSIEGRSDSLIKIHAMDLKIPGVVLTIGRSETDMAIETDFERIIDAVSYIKKAVDVASAYCGSMKGVNIHIKSEMPVGAGLGTSAAVSVATIMAYAEAAGHHLTEAEISSLGHKVESEVQGTASPMDTAVSTYGGLLLVRPSIGKTVMTSVKAGADLPLVVGYTPRECGTGEMLRRVRRLKESAPESVESILSAIGKVVSEAEAALTNGELRKLGTLMDINHGLLESIGVSTKKISEMVYSARSAGALGSKLTGAGGGGCTISLCPGKEQSVMTAISVVGCTSFKSSIARKGVTLECTE